MEYLFSLKIKLRSYAILVCALFNIAAYAQERVSSTNTHGASTPATAVMLRPSPSFEAPKGKYEVAVDTSVTLIDSTRKLLPVLKQDREIPLKIYYPVGKENSPVIIFSHGWSESNASYEYLAAYWASHGYTVILPTHYGIDRSSVGIVLGWPIKIAAHTKQRDKAENSPLDVKKVIDSLPLIQEKIPALKGRIKTEQMAMAGHSWGSYATMILAGAKPTIVPDADMKNLKENRFKAFLNISPQGSNPDWGFTASSWNKIESPTLILRGAADKEVPPWSRPPEWRDESFNNLSSKGGDKYKVVIEGNDATHIAFTGHNMLTTLPSPNKAFQAKVQAVTLAYWKSVFEGKDFEEDPAIKELLLSRSITEEKKSK